MMPWLLITFGGSVAAPTPAVLELFASVSGDLALVGSESGELPTHASYSGNLDLPASEN